MLVTTGGTLSALAAKAATTTIPIVFVTGSDPIKFGLVASLNRPGGNATGVSFLVNVLTAKQFELLHEMVPKAKLIGFLANPINPNTESDTRNVRAAADSLGLLLHVLNASREHDIDAAQHSPSGELTPFSSPPIHTSKSALIKLPRWQPVMRCPRCIHFVRMSPLAV